MKILWCGDDSFYWLVRLSDVSSPSTPAIIGHSKLPRSFGQGGPHFLRRACADDQREDDEPRCGCKKQRNDFAHRSQLVGVAARVWDKQRPLAVRLHGC
jgi:hypothetical protein